MSREIKFNVWDASTETMWIWEHLPNDILEDALDDMGYVPLQYIGLKDKNGKEIYEGDVVSITYKLDEHGDLETDNGVVKYDESSAAFMLCSDWLCNWLMAPSFSIEVIGNIYQHPDKLKDK